jgi:hypothetical protein
MLTFKINAEMLECQAVKTTGGRFEGLFVAGGSMNVAQ